ncbi:glutaredoxin [Demequina capsici]|uniref:Glutaredoxin n=1 Tax=Demequina capsici TaxID=3075620 RepID=A0AA96F549_9MICO|nr:glutaredoxin [Demequina sp. OYTSA14]WNM23934.1 glutaredoxin [Demequina sp. OYTSA14]
MNTSPSRTQITLVQSPACHFCEDAAETLSALAQSFPIEVAQVPLESPLGSRLVAAHRPALNPLVLVDGEYFSAGRLPRKKLTRLLERRAATAAVEVR